MRENQTTYVKINGNNCTAQFSTHATHCLLLNSGKSLLGLAIAEKINEYAVDII